MVKAGPIPCGVSVATKVMFGPWLRGTCPMARCPRGARARRRVMAVWVRVSSTKMRSAERSRAAASRQAVRAASSRSVAIRDFFERQPEATHGTGHGGGADHHPLGRCPGRTVFGSGGVGLGLHLLAQGRFIRAANLPLPPKTRFGR